MPVECRAERADPAMVHPLPLDVLVPLGLVSAVAVLSFLWTLAVSLRFEHGVADLRVEVERLTRLKQERLARARGELVGVTIVDEGAEGVPGESDASGVDAAAETGAGEPAARKAA